MQANYLSKILISTALVTTILSGCGKKAPEVIEMQQTTETVATMTTSGYDKYLEYKAGDNTEILSNATDDGVPIEDNGLTASLEEMLELEYEPVGNGIILTVTNNNDINVSAKIEIEDVSKTINCLEAGSVRSLFINTDSNLLDGGFVINPTEDTELPVITVSAEKSLQAPDDTELKYIANTETYDKETQAKMNELKEKGYDSFDCGKCDDFIIKYYCEGNLMAGSDMKSSECYTFGPDNSMIAVKAPKDLEYDTAEMETYSKLKKSE